MACDLQLADLPPRASNWTASVQALPFLVCLLLYCRSAPRSTQNPLHRSFPTGLYSSHTPVPLLVMATEPPSSGCQAARSCVTVGLGLLRGQSQPFHCSKNVMLFVPVREPFWAPSDRRGHGPWTLASKIKSPRPKCLWCLSPTIH